MNVVLLRVGIDDGAGGIQSPLFADGSFELLRIPEPQGVGDTYGSLRGRDGESPVKYFPRSRWERVASQAVHLDPEFDTFTYGDPTTPKRSLQNLAPGDLLAFYAGLQRWDAHAGWQMDERPALYVIGYFEVALSATAGDIDRETMEREFSANFHIKYRRELAPKEPRLVLVKGGPGSRLLKRAHRISAVGTDRRGRPLKVLSPEMQEIFGDFGGRISIQRSPPRWVDAAFVTRAASFVRGLE